MYEPIRLNNWHTKCICHDAMLDTDINFFSDNFLNGIHGIQFVMTCKYARIQHYQITSNMSLSPISNHTEQR